MKYLLYYEDDPGQGPPFGDTGWWVKKFCGWYGVEPYPLTPGARLEAVTSFPEFAGHAWVWLDADAEHGLVAVPTEDVVFCIGHDHHGFYGYEGEGLRCKLRSMHPDGVDEEYHAAVCATLLLHEVYG